MMNFMIRGHDISDVDCISSLGRKANEVNVHNIQLSLSKSFPNLRSDAFAVSPGMGRYFSQELNRHDVKVAILSCYINMIHPNLDIRERELKKFEAYLRNARYFDAHMVASETGSASCEGFTEENFKENAFSDLLVSIKRLVKCGEKHNTIVAIEAGLNHPLYTLERTKQMLDLIDSDHLGIILDPTNLITADTYLKQVDLVKEAFELYGEKICAIHLKDFIIEKNQIIPVDLGEGIIDYQRIIEIVQKYKPLSYVVLEETKDLKIKDGISLMESTE